MDKHRYACFSQAYEKFLTGRKTGARLDVNFLRCDAGQRRKNCSLRGLRQRKRSVPLVPVADYAMGYPNRCLKRSNYEF